MPSAGIGARRRDTGGMKKLPLPSPDRVVRMLFKTRREARATACALAWEHKVPVTVLRRADGWAVLCGRPSGPGGRPACFDEPWDDDLPAPEPEIPFD